MAISLGFPGYYANVGNIINAVFDITLGADIVTTARLALERHDGLTLKKQGSSSPATAGDIINSVYIIREQEINTFYMSKSAGVDPTTGETALLGL